MHVCMYKMYGNIKEATLDILRKMEVSGFVGGGVRGTGIAETANCPPVSILPFF